MRTAHGQHLLGRVGIGNNGRGCFFFSVGRAHAKQFLLQLAVARQGGCRHVMGYAAVDHDTNSVGNVQRHAQVLLDQKNRYLSAGCQRAQSRLDLLHDDRRQPFGGFVHHQQSWLQQQCASDGQHLLLAARQLCATIAFALCQAREQGVDALNFTPVGGDQKQGFIYRKRWPDPTTLRHVGNTAPGDLVGRHAQDFFSCQSHAACGGNQARDGVAQCGFSHAIAPNDAEYP